MDGVALGRRLLVSVRPLDGRRHTLAVAMAGPATKVLFDGTEAAAYADTPAPGGAFGIRAAPGLSASLCVDLDSIVMRAP